MLNLQTIAESLNTKCGGRAWVFVTSQEDMDKVVGDRTKQQGNDFSKIQARFKTRVKLTSADVEEVIRKRLLEKNDAGAVGARGDLRQGVGELQDAVRLRRRREDLPQLHRRSALRRHLPVRELPVPAVPGGDRGHLRPQRVRGPQQLGRRAVDARRRPAGRQGHRRRRGRHAGDLRPHVRRHPRLAEVRRPALDRRRRAQPRQPARDPPAQGALPRQVRRELPGHAPQPHRARLRPLRPRPARARGSRSRRRSTLLETQTYVQRNGNVYEYLTNEEQVIEEEIKNVDIDASEVSSQLFKILSGDVIKTNKLRYAKNGQDFPFGFKLDDQVHGHADANSRSTSSRRSTRTPPDEIRMHSAGKDELRVILEPDERVLSDLRLLLKTEKYTKRKRTTSLSAIEEQILQSKATLNRDREKELIQRIQRSRRQGRSWSSTPPTIPSSSQDALARVTDGFQELVSRTYTQLKLLGGVTYSEQQVAGAANPDSGLFDADALLEARPARRGGPVDHPPQGRHWASRSRSRRSSTPSRPSPTAGTSPRSRSSSRSLIGSLEGHADRRRQRPQAHRGRHRAAQHAEALARGRRAAEDLRRAQGRRLPQVLHRLLRRGQRAEGPAGAGPPRRRQAQGQARRTQGHRQRLAVPVRRAAQRRRSTCSTRRSASPTTGTSTTSTSATTCSKPRRT